MFDAWVMNGGPFVNERRLAEKVRTLSDHGTHLRLQHFREHGWAFRHEARVLLTNHNLEQALNDLPLEIP